MKINLCLTRLEKLKGVFAEGTDSEKIRLLRILNRRRFSSARQVRRLHDLLCFYHVYPENKEIFQISGSMLNAFSKRGDLKKFKNLLINSGLAGTDIQYQFYWPMARWLSQHWPENFEILWADLETQEPLSKLLPLLVCPSETGVIDELDLDAHEWIKKLKAISETDAEYFVRRLENIYATDLEREALHDDLNLSYVLKSGENTPNISNSTYHNSTVAFQIKPLKKGRPELKSALKESCFNSKKLSPREGKLLVDLARRTMLTHERDLDAFSYGNNRDVRLVDFGDGHQIACIGMIPERRYLLHVTYGFLNLKNGLPIGYFQIISLFNYADIAFNLFEPFRGAEASYIFARNLAVAHQAYEVNSFNLDPYQLGHGNAEGLKSGVWWFYFKLGFRPMDEKIQNTLKQELSKLTKRPDYRTNMKTLDKLASVNLIYNLDYRKSDNSRLENIGYVIVGISEYLSRRFGAAREAGLESCYKEALKITGYSRSKVAGKDSLAVWKRWAPLVLAFGSLNKWSKAERLQLAEIIESKGQADELGYLMRVNRHKRLKNKILNYGCRVCDED